MIDLPLPEIQDKNQLDLFSEVSIRDPPAEVSEREIYFDNASSLHRKSRELVKKNFNKKPQENDNLQPHE